MTKSKDLIQKMSDVTELKIPYDSDSHYLRNKSVCYLACFIKEYYQKVKILKEQIVIIEKVQGRTEII